MRLSVIIPTLNEAAALPRTLASLCSAAVQPPELIVSDCQSRDGTADLARSTDARVVTGGTCRAEAMNRGAAAATGEILLFLHADTQLPAGFDETIFRALSIDGIVGGAFNFAFDREGHSLRRRDACSLRFIELINGFRYRWGRRFYGDQAIFVGREVFSAIGGFPALPLMEDIHFCARLARRGRTAIVHQSALTSPRRFLARGPLRQLAEDVRLLVLDSFGARPHHLWQRYNRVNDASSEGVTTPDMAASLRPPASCASLVRAGVDCAAHRP